MQKPCFLFLICYRVFILVVVGLLVAWLAVDTRQNPEKLISFGGVCLFILGLFIFSANRYAVSTDIGILFKYEHINDLLNIKSRC